MAAFGLYSNTSFANILKNSLNIKYFNKYLSINSFQTKLRDMPKDNTELLQKLRDNRKNNAKKNAKNTIPSNLFQLNVLGNGSEGNPRALYIITDRNSYLFNCGEGTQRLANEHKSKLAKLENVFITKRSSENLSGLVGLALTCQDIGVPSLTLHGPQNLEILLSLYEYFFKFSGMTVKTNSYVDYNYEDIDILVKCFPIFQSIKEDKQMNKKFKTEPNSVIDEKEMSFLYLCRLKSRPGELLVQKCIDLKIPPGPLLGKLKSGEQVVLSDNRIICSQDVIGPEDKGPIFIVLECPSVDYIDSLVTNESIFENLRNGNSEHLLTVVIHFTPSEVFEEQRYQQWIKRLGDSVDHLLLNEDTPSEGNVAANRIQIKLNLIDSFVFPLLHSNQKITQKSEKVFNAKTLTKFNLRPKNLKGIDLETAVNDYDVQGFRNEALSNSAFVQSLSEFESQISKLEPKIVEYPEVIFLGTGSAVPSKMRNTSAIWVNIDSETSFLLDCGEGTYGQLYRFYGSETQTYLKKLKAIYVSHLHADHHLGILQLLKKRSRLTSEPLIMIIPPAVCKWLLKYNQSVEKISNSYQIILCQEFIEKTNHRVLEILRLKELKTVLVPHCAHSYGISFTIKGEPNFKIVYSGDTQPTANLVRIGKNCDLLIHEASMEDGLVEEARLKFHSTTSEAIEKGIDMNAKFTILTHFSQRYAKVPVFNEMFNERVGIAFDNMRVRFSDLPKLPKMIPCLKCLFEEQIGLLAQKTAQMAKRKQLIAQYHENNSQSNQT